MYFKECCNISGTEQRPVLRVTYDVAYCGIHSSAIMALTPRRIAIQRTAANYACHYTYLRICVTHVEIQAKNVMNIHCI